jgi:hypothetical protein
LIANEEMAFKKTVENLVVDIAGGKEAECV